MACIAMATSGLIQLLYWLLLYNRIYRRSRTLKRDEAHFSTELPPLSVIIYAHDECENLRRNLTAVLEQDYPRFEVIVVSDGQADDSKDFLTQMEDRYTHLYHSFVPDSSRYISRKKLGLTIGIKASKYDWLVLTDASCQPAGTQWLRTMARNFTSRTDVVLGYSGYEPKKSWSARKISFCQSLFSIRYLTLAMAGMPYMGTGRNVAYRKEVFFKQKGFSAHLNLQRGDDDLFLNQVMRGSNTRVETAAEAAVHMPVPRRMHEWHEEHVGYTLTAKLYRGVHRYLTGGETTSRLCFYLSYAGAIAAAACLQQWVALGVAAAAGVARWGVQATVLNLTFRALGEQRRYYLLLPLLDLIQPLYSLRWKLSCRFRNKSEFLRK